MYVYWMGVVIDYNMLKKPLYIIMYLDMYKDRIQNSSFFTQPRFS